jgi:uncharacterized membrane protein|tara:strand:+ start:1196 stop:1630 length:435 start_codon:yes stop_codon:yes gene_type:complete
MYLLIISGFISSIRLLIEKKQLLKTFTSEEYMIIKYAMTFFSMIFYLIYKTKVVKPIIKKIDKKIISILIFNSILGIVSSLIFYYILQNHKIFYILSVITPISIIFSIVFSYYLYNEKISKYDCVGIFFTALGIVFLNYDDSPK